MGLGLGAEEEGPIEGEGEGMSRWWVARREMEIEGEGGMRREERKVGRLNAGDGDGEGEGEREREREERGWVVSRMRM